MNLRFKLIALIVFLANNFIFGACDNPVKSLSEGLGYTGDEQEPIEKAEDSERAKKLAVKIPKQRIFPGPCATPYGFKERRLKQNQEELAKLKNELEIIKSNIGSSTNNLIAEEEHDLGEIDQLKERQAQLEREIEQLTQE